MHHKYAVVFGAGKIARGFIAHLLQLSGYHITFVERQPDLVAQLRARGSYRIHIMGAPERSDVISGFGVLSSADLPAVARQVSSADVVFVSIGGPNLPEIAPHLAEGIARACAAGRPTPLNIILAENYFQPARWLRDLIGQRLSPGAAAWFSENVGIVETMVLRSTVEPDGELRAQDPLALKAQDMWEMPADKNAFIGDPPPVRGLIPKDDFQGGLVRKLFTYNALNAVISYPGYLKGYELLSDAANDPELASLARAAGEESSRALCAAFGFDPEDQRRFAESALAKYQKREIVDPIERNTRDPIRKLARHDRLIGPASLALEHGIQPLALSQGIGAALRYDYPGDPAAQRLQAIIRQGGLDAAFIQVCGIEPHGELAALIREACRQWSKS